ncbi:MAG: PAS domain S-box protein [Syntrophales bacterium]|nr:PAS domain S-box protein [Syntrophales bacterium]
MREQEKRGTGRRRNQREKAAMAMLQQSEERFRLATEAANIIVYDVDLNSHVIRAMHGLRAFLGRDLPDNASYEWWTGLIHPEDRNRLQSEISEVLAVREQSHTFVYRVLHGDRHYRIVQDTIYFQYENGRLVGHIGGIKDITDRVRAEESLRESKKRYQDLVETVGDMIFETDELGRIAYVSPNITDILGYSPGDVIGKVPTDFLSPDETGNLKEFFLRCAAKRKKIEAMTATYLHRDGRKVILETNAVPFLAEDGSLRGYRGVNRDISERKVHERQLQDITLEARRRAAEAEESKRRLEEINRELESFSYSISHDLRAPLRAIDGFSGMILQDFSEVMDAELKRRFDVIRENARRMNRLIDDLLAISRLGQCVISKRPVNMEKLFRQTWMELLPAYPGRKVWMQVHKMITPVSGDRTLLKQLVANLLNNALKYTRDRERALVEIGGLLKDREIVFYVKDNGVGFNMRYKDKLFRIFQRLHSPSEFEGTGIGLAIVQRIVNMHGGRVWAESKVGEGATFFFSLPAEA